MGDYNGWANCATWNVALWIQNDYCLYNSARSYCAEMKKAGKSITYSGFVKWAGLAYERTPDRFKFSGQSLNRRELTEMLREIA